MLERELPAARLLDESLVDDGCPERHLGHVAERRRVRRAEAPRFGKTLSADRIRHVLRQHGGEVPAGRVV